MLAGGCATKKYVRNQTAPIQAKVDQVGETTQKQGQDIQESRQQIKQVDENAQNGISAAKESAMTANNKATEAASRANDAMNKATQANDAAETANREVTGLKQTVASLDDYKMQTEVSVPFRFNHYTLDSSAKEDLDKLASTVNSYKRFYITIEGFTDKTGPVSYNEQLSRKRADSVAEYLVAKLNIPLYRIHMIGLGEAKPVSLGKGRAARAKNRRVEVRIFTADQNATNVSQVNTPTQ